MKTSLIKIQAHYTSKQALDLSKFDSNFYSKGFIGLAPRSLGATTTKEMTLFSDRGICQPEKPPV